MTFPPRQGPAHHRPGSSGFSPANDPDATLARLRAAADAGPAAYELGEAAVRLWTVALVVFLCALMIAGLVFFIALFIKLALWLF